MEGGLADPDALQAGVISQERADLIFGEVEPLPEEETAEQIPYGPLSVQQAGLRFNEVMAPTVEKLRSIWRLLQQVPPMGQGSGVGPQAAVGVDDVGAALDEVFAGHVVESSHQRVRQILIHCPVW